MTETTKRPVKLLICKCQDCTHWEVVNDNSVHTLLCKTCGLEIPVTIHIPAHSEVHWADHER